MGPSCGLLPCPPDAPSLPLSLLLPRLTLIILPSPPRHPLVHNTHTPHRGAPGVHVRHAHGRAVDEQAGRSRDADQLPALLRQHTGACSSIQLHRSPWLSLSLSLSLTHTHTHIYIYILSRHLPGQVRNATLAIRTQVGDKTRRQSHAHAHSRTHTHTHTHSHILIMH